MLESRLEDREKGLNDRPNRASLGGGTAGKIGSFLGSGSRSAWCTYAPCGISLLSQKGERTETCYLHCA
jgi:hypothetical protein